MPSVGPKTRPVGLARPLLPVPTKTLICWPGTALAVPLEAHDRVVAGVDHVEVVVAGLAGPEGQGDRDVHVDERGIGGVGPPAPVPATSVPAVGFGVAGLLFRKGARNRKIWLRFALLALL